MPRVGSPCSPQFKNTKQAMWCQGLDPGGELGTASQEHFPQGQEEAGKRQILHKNLDTQSESPALWPLILRYSSQRLWKTWNHQKGEGGWKHSNFGLAPISVPVQQHHKRYPLYSYPARLCTWILPIFPKAIWLERRSDWQPRPHLLQTVPTEVDPYLLTRTVGSCSFSIHCPSRRSALVPVGNRAPQKGRRAPHAGKLMKPGVCPGGGLQALHNSVPLAGAQGPYAYPPLLCNQSQEGCVYFIYWEGTRAVRVLPPIVSCDHRSFWCYGV